MPFFPQRPCFSHKYLGEFLVEHGFLSTAQLAVALLDQADSPQSLRLGEILILRGWINSEVLEDYIMKIVEPRRKRQAFDPPVANAKLALLV